MSPVFLYRVLAEELNARESSWATRIADKLEANERRQAKLELKRQFPRHTFKLEGSELK